MRFVRGRIFAAALPVALLLLAGCSQAGTGEMNMPDHSKDTLEEKIKRVEASDMPAPVKEKAIQELRAKQK